MVNFSLTFTQCTDFLLISLYSHLLIYQKQKLGRRRNVAPYKNRSIFQLCLYYMLLVAECQLPFHVLKLKLKL